jgi:hypothetical protein
MILESTEETRRILEDIDIQLKGLDREEERKESNNSYNPNQNLCCISVTNYFRTTKLYKYLHTSGDLIISLTKKHNIVIKDSLVKGLIVEEGREVLKTNSLNENVVVKGYVLALYDHTILLNEFGETIVDINSKDYDDRIIDNCTMII